MSTTTITLDQRQITIIRRALIVGLACHGEIDRLLERWKIPPPEAEALREQLEPVDQHGDADQTRKFAEALDALEQGEAE